MQKLAILILVLALTGCAGSGITKEQAENVADGACIAADFAHGLFQLCRQDSSFPKHGFCQQNAETEAKVFIGVQVACTKPYSAAPGVLLQRVNQAIRQIQALGVGVGPVAPGQGP